MPQYEIREKVRRAYSAAAQRPNERHPFPVGRGFAQSLGYSDDVLKGIPNDCVDAFSGVSNVPILADIAPSAYVLDLGCGAGLDSLIAARRVGPDGKVIGIDFSTDMLARARQGARRAAIGNVVFGRADAERLPIGDGWVSVALVNGIFNLNPVRDAIFRELARVVRTDGAVYSAELILSQPLPPEYKRSEADWFA